MCSMCFPFDDLTYFKTTSTINRRCSLTTASTDFIGPLFSQPFQSRTEFQIWLDRIALNTDCIGYLFAWKFMCLFAWNGNNFVELIVIILR